MIEKTVLDFLESELKVPVFLEVPAKDEPATYIILEKTGGTEENRIRQSSIAVQTIAGSLYEASELSERAKEAMDGIISLPEIARCELASGPYNFTDTSTKRRRYQAIYDLVHY